MRWANAPQILTFIMLTVFKAQLHASPEALRADSLTAEDRLHHQFDRLLQRYVTRSGVRYQAWKEHFQDLNALKTYLQRLQQVNPVTLSRSGQLAYWINLYNAATLNLVLDHYPIASIKDIGGPLRSPWKKKVVKVAGRELTLDDIENKILRPKYRDARIHFALNCAAVSCPPLAPRAYLPSRIDEQLEAATQQALRQDAWLAVRDGKIYVTRLFDWYRSDFEQAAGSVRAFLARYRPDLRRQLLEEEWPIVIMDYDWRLNEAQ